MIRRARMIGLFLIVCLFLSAVSVWGDTQEGDNLSREETDTEKQEMEKTDSDPEMTMEEDEPDLPKENLGYTITLVDPLLETETIMMVERGEEAVMPEVEEIDGYRAAGWSIMEGAETASYQQGQAYRITMDMTVYAVRNQLYQVTFWTNTGKTTQRLQDLTIEGIRGEIVTLPELPIYTGYRSFGWTDTPQGTKVTNPENSSYQITGDMQFYQINRKILSVTFCNNAGTGGYADLTQTGVAGESVKIPKQPEKTGFQSLGWAAVKGSSTVRYQEGDSITLSQDVKLYAVYKWIGTCTVRFYTYAGGYEYKSMRMKVTANTVIKLPSLPRRLNYKSVGWGRAKTPSWASLQKAGTQVRVKKSMNFYGYWQKAISIQFMYNDGKQEYITLRKDYAGSSAVITLPSAYSPGGYTFLGWSTTEKQSSYPKYQMGQRITVKKSTKLYAVLMKKPMTSVSEAHLSDSTKFDMVFFIGDSRTVGMHSALKQANLKKVRFFAKSGMGLEWFQEEKANLIAQVKAAKGKKAIVWNLGINDLLYLNASGSLEAVGKRYVREMTELETVLRSYNCTLYFMSVNPSNDKEAVSTAYGGISWTRRAPSWIMGFNSYMKSNLPSWKYIDTYNYLINTGFELEDGLHYSTECYKKIYKRAISAIDAN